MSMLPDRMPAWLKLGVSRLNGWTDCYTAVLCLTSRGGTEVALRSSADVCSVPAGNQLKRSYKLKMVQKQWIRRKRTATRPALNTVMLETMGDVLPAIDTASH